MRAFSRGLHVAGVGVDQWLDARGLAGVIRSAYDPASIPVMERRASIDSAAAGVRPEAAGPIAVDESWDRIRTDSGWHATYWISEWPRVEAHAQLPAPAALRAGGTPVAVDRLRAGADPPGAT